MKSSTEVLRALLDERGAEWSATVGASGTIWTHWDAFNGHRVHAMDNEDGTVEIFGEWDVTPEQAIAATLGAETCRNTSKVTDAHGQARFVCSECRAWIDLRVLWNPDYPNGESPWVRDCKLNYCPNCGARVEDE